MGVVLQRERILSVEKKGKEQERSLEKSEGTVQGHARMESRKRLEIEREERDYVNESKWAKKGNKGRAWKVFSEGTGWLRKGGNRRERLKRQ